MTNQDLVRLVSRPMSVQKVWVMLQKKEASSTFLSGSSHSSQSGQQVLDVDSSGLTPRPGYIPNFRAQIVQINLHHPSSVGTPMDLTPSIGPGITQFIDSVSRRKSAMKRSLCFGLPSVSKRYSLSNETFSHNVSHSTNASTPAGIAHNMSATSHTESVVKLLTRNRTDSISIQESPCIICNQRCSCIRPISQTPVNSHRGIAPIVETPTVSSDVIENQSTPSKLLTTKLGNFTLSDSCVDDSEWDTTGFNAVWYQIDFALKGFRDVCLKQ